MIDWARIEHAHRAERVDAMHNALRKVLVPSWAALLLLARSAGAQEAAGHGMHEAGTFILSAERLFGLSFWTVNRDVPAAPPFVAGGTITTSGTTVSLLYSSPAAVAVPYQTPKIAFDYTVIESLTVGGAIGYVSMTGEQEAANGVSQDTASARVFTIAPRAGYALQLVDWFYFWPRLGFTYFNVSVDSPPNNAGIKTTDSINGFGLNIEPGFVFVPVPHFGITVFPVADIPLTGTYTNENAAGGAVVSTDVDSHVRNFGLTVGVLGYF